MKLIGLLFIGLFALMSGCAGATVSTDAASKPLGTVTGVASPCIGVASMSYIRTLPVRVTLRHYGRVVAHQTVTGSHVYRISRSPGRYLLSSNQSRTKAIPVTLCAGRRELVNLHVSCE